MGRFSTVLGLGFVGFFCAASANEQIDDLVLEEMRVNDIPGLAVAVVSGGNVVKLGTYGVANVELDVSVTPGSVFELASLTKHFTAAAVLLLAEEGKLGLNDQLSNFVEDAPPEWSEIRISHLLNHTAGLADRFEETLDGRQIMDHSSDDMLRSAMDTPTIGRPGEQWQYSDQGYFLLGWIIEQASGMQYPNFVRERLLEPAGMTESYLHTKELIIPSRVAGYEVVDGETQNVRRDWQFEISSHFGLMASVEDLVKWERSLVDRSVLDEGQLHSMWNPSWFLREARDSSVGYGMGWFVVRFSDRTFVEHTGVTGTSYFRDLERNLAVVILSNRTFYDVSSLGRRIAKLIDPSLPFPDSAL
jgi:CubicO group peptidase (beta-lactamase class C family)